MKLTLKNISVPASGAILIVLLFILASFIANEPQFKQMILAGGNSGTGMAVYVLLAVVATVIAPVSTVPLIPIASGLWGWQVTTLLSVIGWGIGAQAAYHIARYFGKPLIAKIVPLEKLSRFENRLSGKDIFWTVVFLRMAVPVDILSYAIGLFSGMKAIPYLFATLIGITPFAIIFAYAGHFSVKIQLAALGAGLAVAVLGYYMKNKPR